MSRGKNRRWQSWARANAQYVLLGCVAIATAALVVLALSPAELETRPAAKTPIVTPTPGASAAPAPNPVEVTPIRFAAVGDSITAGDSADFSGGAVGDLSWVTWANSDDVTFVGGWADAAADTTEMLENATPVEADVLVIVAGTEDATAGVPFPVIASNISRMVQAMDPERVIVSSIPPQDDNPEPVTAFNASLQEFVVTQEWEWVDAAADVRDGDTYLPGLTSDGVHPTEEAARILGENIQQAILGGR